MFNLLAKLDLEPQCWYISSPGYKPGEMPGEKTQKQTTKYWILLPFAQDDCLHFLGLRCLSRHVIAVQRNHIKSQLLSHGSTWSKSKKPILREPLKSRTFRMFKLWIGRSVCLLTQLDWSAGRWARSVKTLRMVSLLWDCSIETFAGLVRRKPIANFGLCNLTEEIHNKIAARVNRKRGLSTCDCENGDGEQRRSKIDLIFTFGHSINICSLYQ